MDRLSVARSASTQAIYQLCTWIEENGDTLLITEQTWKNLGVLLDVLEIGKNGLESLHAEVYEANARFTWNISQEARLGEQNDQSVGRAGSGSERRSAE